MSLHFAAWNLTAPSHRYMRRMLDGLRDDVAVLSDIEPPGEPWRSRHTFVNIGPPPMTPLRRARLFAGELRGKRPRPHRAVSAKAIARAVNAPRVTRVLTHFLNAFMIEPQPFVDSGKPIFVHCHGGDVTWNHRDATGRHYSHPDGYKASVLALPANVSLIANSPLTRRWILAAGIADGRVHVKTLGVEVPPEPPPREPRGGPLRILYLGRLVDLKGPDLVIRAFEIACARGLDATLTLAGDGPLWTTCALLRERSPVRDCIVMPGATDDAEGTRLRAWADVFTAHNCHGPLSNQEESFGVSLVEAMAAALPVVNASSGSVPETLGPPYRDLLFAPGDVEAHADRFLLFAADAGLRRDLGRAGWQYAHAHYRLDQEIDALRRILDL